VKITPCTPGECRALKPPGRYARPGAAWARWPSRSSKPVRSCNPRLGRFDSCAAPLSRNPLSQAGLGALGPLSAVAPSYRLKPLKAARDWRSLGARSYRGPPTRRRLSRRAVCPLELEQEPCDSVLPFRCRLGPNGTASIRPATGGVEPGSALPTNQEWPRPCLRPEGLGQDTLPPTPARTRPLQRVAERQEDTFTSRAGAASRTPSPGRHNEVLALQVESCSPRLIASRVDACWRPSGFRPGFWPQGQFRQRSSPGARPRLCAPHSARRIALYTWSQCEETSSNARAVVRAAASSPRITFSTSSRRVSLSLLSDIACELIRVRRDCPSWPRCCLRLSVSSMWHELGRCS
jgi:hypothetical protein